VFNRRRTGADLSPWSITATARARRIPPVGVATPRHGGGRWDDSRGGWSCRWEAAMLSPGKPPIPQEMERALGQDRRGLTSEDAAIAFGVSGAVGSRWFRKRGGMPTTELSPPTDSYLSFAEREETALLWVQGRGVRAIRRSPSTISRELRRIIGSAPTEHERRPAPVLAQGNRPVPLGSRRDRACRNGTQLATARDPRLEDAR
jgi:hypothetical protein